MSTIATNNAGTFASPTANAAGFSALVWLSAGCLAAILYQFNLIPRLEFVVLAMVAVTVTGMVAMRVTRMSALPRLMVLLYSLPFATTIGYLLNADYACWPLLQDASRYSHDHALMGRMLMTAIVGLLGLLTGIEAGALWFRRQHARFKPALRSTIQPGATLDGLMFLFLLGSAFMLSWLSTPKETILEASYGSVDRTLSIAGKLNFNAAAAIAYVILVLLFIDTERERAGSIARRFKLRLVILLTVYIVVFHQLLRGSRTVADLVAALAILYLTSADVDLHWLRARLVQRRKLMKLVLPLVLITCAFLCLSNLRHSLSINKSLPSLAEVGGMLGKACTTNTWTNIALTNLGMAMEAADDPPPLLFGRTYLDYFLSLPPGTLCRLVGYERPVERCRGPSWWYDVGMGGVHPVVVPYRNFGIVGAFAIPALFGVFFARCELLNTTYQLWPRFLYGAVLANSLHWFWYGDMYIIRGVMAAMILIVFYRFAAQKQQIDFKHLSRKTAT